MVGIQHDFKDVAQLNKSLIRAGLFGDETVRDFSLKSCFSWRELFHEYGIFMPELLNFSPEQKTLDMLNMHGCFVPIKEAYEFDSVAKGIVEFSCMYSSDVFENMAKSVALNFDVIKTQVMTKEFDECLKKSIKSHSRLVKILFEEYFKDGHEKSEALHLKRMFNLI